MCCVQEGIEDRLDPRRFPFLTGGSRSVGLGSAPVRYSCLDAAFFLYFQLLSFHLTTEKSSVMHTTSLCVFCLLLSLMRLFAYSVLHRLQSLFWTLDCCFSGHLEIPNGDMYTDTIEILLESPPENWLTSLHLVKEYR